MASRGFIARFQIASCFLLALAGLLLASAQTFAAVSSEWQRSPESSVRLLSAVTGTGDLRSLPIGLEFALAPGWKTYWRSPGEGGYPPKLDWSGSENVGSAEIAWPAPERFTILGIDSIGYAGAVVLPIKVRLLEPGQPALLRLAVDYLTCEEICIPQRAQLTLSVPAGPAAPSQFAHLIDRYRGRVPGPPGPTLSVESAEWVELDGKPALRAEIAAAQPLNEPDLFIEGIPSAAWGSPSFVLAQEGHGASMIVSRLDTAARPLGGEPVTLTLTDGGHAIEQEVTVRPGMTTAVAQQQQFGSGLLFALAVALLGGLILNLMPCVLPVLSIKVLGLLGHGGADLSAARRSFLATSAGIVACFLLLAVGAAGVRAAGMAVGWGMQFQQPIFLAIMAMVLVLFACNLWGFYEISLPHWLRMGGGTSDSGLTGSFLTGMLATLLATPCSAPFVGTAVAYALSRGTSEIFMIFTALGLGLALPYLAVALYPRMATALPRPGRWMVWLKRVLGFALLGTGVWLLSVLQAQTGPRTTLIVAGAAVGTIAFFWIGRGFGGRVRAAAAGALVIMAAASAFFVGTERASGPGLVADSRWYPFDQDEIDRLVGQGRVVFVDVTADWCITCQVNKAAVLERDPVAGRLFANDQIHPMRADWTRPNDEIAAYLASFGRYGIPFNAVYGPGAPAGLALPELLSAEAVVTALDKASGSPTQHVSSR